VLGVNGWGEFRVTVKVQAILRLGLRPWEDVKCGKWPSPISVTTAL